jgi:hypothetical protein
MPLGQTLQEFIDDRRGEIAVEMNANDDADVHDDFSIPVQRKLYDETVMHFETLMRAIFTLHNNKVFHFIR